MTTVPLPTPLAPTAPPAAAPSPLSPDQLIEYQSALQRSKKIRRAILVAATDAWLTGIFAALTFLTGIFSPISFLLGAALAFIAFNSFRGLRGLKRFDLSAPKLLALNQLLLIAIVTAYAIYALWDAAYGKSDMAAMISSPELASASGFNVEKLAWYLSLAVYGGVILATFLAQGSAALYYLSRRKHLQAYLAQTPPWIISLQKAQAGA